MYFDFPAVLFLVDLLPILKSAVVNSLFIAKRLHPHTTPLVFNDEILPVILHFSVKVYSPNVEVIRWSENMR